MANTKIKSGISNKRARITANDLSLLNGISEKINEEYLKNIREIFNKNTICEPIWYLQAFVTVLYFICN